MSDKPKPKRRGDKLVWYRGYCVETGFSPDGAALPSIDKETFKTVKEVFIADSHAPNGNLYWRKLRDFELGDME